MEEKVAAEIREKSGCSVYVSEHAAELYFRALVRGKMGGKRRWSKDEIEGLQAACLFKVLQQNPPLPEMTPTFELPEFINGERVLSKVTVRRLEKEARAKK